jgi:hypothetical protein
MSDENNSKIDLIIDIQKDYERTCAALRATRDVLINLGFCGPGNHGAGDPEIKAIDDALERRCYNTGK